MPNEELPEGPERSVTLIFWMKIAHCDRAGHFDYSPHAAVCIESTHNDDLLQIELALESGSSRRKEYVIHVLKMPSRCRWIPQESVQM